MGGGVGISVFSPFRIATENTLFAMPETKIGFFTDVCGGYFLSRLRNNIGYYLGLTGMRLKGEEVYKAGIANYFIPRERLPQVYSDLKRELAHSREPKETIDEILLRYNQPPVNRVIEHEDDIRYIFNSQSVEEIFEKLKQNKTPFYAKIREAIEGQCPLSVHVTFRSIEESKRKTAKDCFITDYSISQHFMAGKDFFEGVRCTLVDKGSKPTWSHPNILAVRPEEVDKYFEPLTSEKLLRL